MYIILVFLSEMEHTRLQLDLFLPLLRLQSSESISYNMYSWNILTKFISYHCLQLFGKAKPAIFMTILISAVVHEYILAVGLGFASPILLFLFAGPGGEWAINMFVVAAAICFRMYSHPTCVSIFSLGISVKFLYRCTPKHVAGIGK